MSTYTTPKKIILRMAPFAWVQKITAGALSALWTFNNLQSGTLKIPLPGASSANANNLDIKRGDGVIWRFTKTNLILDGTDESDITPADASSDATGFGEMTIVINEAPVESNSWTAFLKSVKDNLESMFLVTICTGLTHQSGVTDKKPDGFAHMICKLSVGVDQALSENPTSLTLTFVSYINSGLEEADLTGATFATMKWKLGGTNDVSNIAVPTLVTADSDELLAGKVALVSNITYTYT